MNAEIASAPLTHGIDVSRYDPAVDWQMLAAGGISFAIVKASQGDYRYDPMAGTHLRGAAEAGLVTGIYHWCDPLRDDEAQVTFLLNSPVEKAYQFVCLDVEQYWADWADWPKPRKGKKKKGNLSANRISQNAYRMASLLRENVPEGMPVVIYTRTSFISEHARPMLGWLGGFPLWLAQYPTLRGVDPNLAWADLETLPGTGFHPTLPSGCADWTFWQWSGGRFRLPGISSLPDLNVFRGSRTDLEQFAPLCRQSGV